MTKAELGAKLKAGFHLIDLFQFCPGQECEIYKASAFAPGDEVIYISDMFLHGICIDGPIIDPDTLECALSNCFTGNDFMEVCNGDRQKAEELFGYCDWQHPSSAWDEGALAYDEHDMVQTPLEVVIRVEQGRVSEVYASSNYEIIVNIIDSDTDDLDRRADIKEEISLLETQVADGKLHQIF